MEEQGIEKAIGSAIMSLISVLTLLGVTVPQFLTENFVMTLVGIVVVVLAQFGVTWLVPNSKKSATAPTPSAEGEGANISPPA